MSLQQWFGFNVRYARKLASSGFEGAVRGREEFLEGEPIAPFLKEAARESVTPAVVGACLGALVALWQGRDSTGKRQSVSRTLSHGLLGGVIGFGAALAWRTRGLAANIARRTLENTHPVRDERWLERHPINYG